MLKFSENLTKLRRQHKITQEELANFIGVTKASVSKWETGQNLPDIMLLLEIATYFDVSVDTLLDYEPQLNKEKIASLYQSLAQDFASKPTDEVIKKCKKLIKKYYSCYPFLLQMVILLLNHFMIYTDKEKSFEVLQYTLEICEHILSNCTDLNICNDTIFCKANVNLLLGNFEQVIETLEKVVNLNPLLPANQNEILLIQAYQMTERTKEADRLAQSSILLHLIGLINTSIQYMTAHQNDISLCNTTIERVDNLINLYNFEQIQPNSCAIFNYQSAIYYMVQNEADKSINRLKKFEKIFKGMVKDTLKMTGSNPYFTMWSEWINVPENVPTAPREVKFVIESAIQMMNNPVFLPLNDNAEFLGIKSRIENLMKNI
ncbi:MAG: helix-turn-helix transcriptional regulator [Acutalibacteraceae bacterium]|nr:helix-turn-helix transcriptional regulator [Acutalibacteraceae bacterium]